MDKQRTINRINELHNLSLFDALSKEEEAELKDLKADYEEILEQEVVDGKKEV